MNSCNHVIYLLGFLNIFCFVFIIYLCARILKPVQERHGSVTYGVLIIVVLAGVYSGCGNHPETTDKKWKLNEDTGKVYKKAYVTKLIKNNSMFKVYVGISYIFREKDSEPIPIEAIAYINGTLSGIEWKPLNILAYGSGHTIIYVVNEEEKWTLSGFPVVISADILKGEVSVQ